MQLLNNWNENANFAKCWRFEPVFSGKRYDYVGYGNDVSNSQCGNTNNYKNKANTNEYRPWEFRICRQNFVLLFIKYSCICAIHGIGQMRNVSLKSFSEGKFCHDFAKHNFIAIKTIRLTRIFNEILILFINQPLGGLYALYYRGFWKKRQQVTVDIESVFIISLASVVGSLW